jgi:hypothetical protein
LKEVCFAMNCSRRSAWSRPLFKRFGIRILSCIAQANRLPLII